MPSNKLDDYEVLCTIGSGSYGTCKKIQRKSDKKVGKLACYILDGIFLKLIAAYYICRKFGIFLKALLTSPCETRVFVQLFCPMFSLLEEWGTPPCLTKLNHNFYAITQSKLHKSLLVRFPPPFEKIPPSKISNAPNSTLFGKPCCQAHHFSSFTLFYVKLEDLLVRWGGKNFRYPVSLVILLTDWHNRLLHYLSIELILSASKLNVWRRRGS